MLIRNTPLWRVPTVLTIRATVIQRTFTLSTFASAAVSARKEAGVSGLVAPFARVPVIAAAHARLDTGSVRNTASRTYSCR